MPGPLKGAPMVVGSTRVVWDLPESAGSNALNRCLPLCLPRLLTSSEMRWGFSPHSEFTFSRSTYLLALPSGSHPEVTFLKIWRAESTHAERLLCPPLCLVLQYGFPVWFMNLPLSSCDVVYMNVCFHGFRIERFVPLNKWFQCSGKPLSYPPQCFT